MLRSAHMPCPLARFLPYRSEKGCNLDFEGCKILLVTPVIRLIPVTTFLSILTPDLAAFISIRLLGLSRRMIFDW